ncbi:MAG TPA: acyl-CoA dehydrogenase family protein [Gaiellales bacterium]|nr:acyl-CoA dehydrogenase family protein [Gaiellales bacterium]
MLQRAEQFTRTEIRPHVADWEAAASYPRAAVARSGLTGLFAPVAVGGCGLGYPEAMAVFEQLGRGDAALAFSLSMHNAVAAAVATAGGALAERWAQPLAEGRALGGFALTEPQAGSDATAITTRVDADLQRVSGRKAWVSLAGEADLFLVVCRTGEGGGHGDIAMMAVERDQPGVAFPKLYRTACARFLQIGEMLLDGAAGTVVAPPGAGMRAALAAIDVARCDIAAIAAGLHAEALDVAVAYARSRSAFGKRLIDLQGVAFPLADVATELEASRLLYGRAADMLGTPAGTVACAHAKRHAADAALRAAAACGEVLGAYGWLDDHRLARFLTLAKMLQVVDGTAEIQRLVIARSLDRG